MGGKNLYHMTSSTMVLTGHLKENKNWDPHGNKYREEQNNLDQKSKASLTKLPQSVIK